MLGLIIFFYLGIGTRKGIIEKLFHMLLIDKFLFRNKFSSLARLGSFPQSIMAGLKIIKGIATAL
jgi:hypothetical protein